MGALLVKMTVPFPRKGLTNDGHARLKRSRWRVLLMVLRMRFEAAEAGLGTIEQHFLGDIVMPDGQTVDQWVRLQIGAMIESGKMPATLMIEGPRK